MKALTHGFCISFIAICRNLRELNLNKQRYISDLLDLSDFLDFINLSDVIDLSDLISLRDLIDLGDVTELRVVYQ